MSNTLRSLHMQNLFCLDFIRTKMQSNINDSLDLDKRKTYSGQYDVPPPYDCGACTQLQEQTRAKYSQNK